MIFLDKVIKVKRLKNIGGNTRQYVATATGEASIQPIAAEPNSIDDGRFGTLYIGYTEVDLPVMKGDQVTEPDGTVYVVKEVITRDTIPFPHKAITLTRK